MRARFEVLVNVLPYKLPKTTFCVLTETPDVFVGVPGALQLVTIVEVRIKMFEPPSGDWLL